MTDTTVGNDGLFAPEADTVGAPVVDTWRMSHPACPHLFQQLALAQRDLTNPPKDRTANVASTRGQYSYDYSDLATVLDTVRPVFSKHGLAILQWASVAVGRDGQPWGYITTVVSWSDGTVGEWVAGTVGLPLMDTKPQTLGSLQTYLRRYSLNAVAGIAGEPDDDASLAQGVAATTAPKASAAAVPVPPPSKPTSTKTITEPQQKFLKVELSKASVDVTDVVAWYNRHFEVKTKSPAEFLMSRFDDVLRWVREGDTEYVVDESEPDGDDV